MALRGHAARYDLAFRVFYLKRVPVSSLFVKFSVKFRTGMPVLNGKSKISVPNRFRV